MKNRDVIISLAALLVMALLFALPPLLRPANTDPVATIKSALLANNPDGPWQPANLGRLTLPGNHGWLKVEFTIPGAALKEDAPPIGLYLSGTFSANALWNGTEVGQKGQPGNADNEIPGPVDAVFFLHDEDLVAGTNTLLLEMSSHYRPANINTIIHGTNGSGEIFGLRVAPYTAEPRRTINYYVVPLLVITLSVVALSLLLIHTNPRRRATALPAVLIATIIVAAAAEITRSFVAYPYQYHPLRINIITLSVTVFFISLVLHVYQLQYKQTRWYLVAGLGVGLYIFAWLVSTITTYIYASLALLAIAVYCVQFHNHRPRIYIHDWRLFAALVFLFGAAFVDDGIFFDRYLYISVIPLLTVLIWPPNSVANENNVKPPTLNKLVLKSAGKQRFIEFDAITTISGSGSYAEVTLSDGAKFLDDRPLKTLSKLLPTTFYRCHRSHIINLEKVDSLHSEGGGRYTVKLSNGDNLPASRDKVRELRELIGLKEESLVSR